MWKICCMNAASISATKPMAVASTPGRRTVPYHYDEGKERCSASGRCEVCRSLLPSTARFIIISINSVISTADRISNRTVPPHLPSGGNSAPVRAGSFQKPKTGSSLSDNTLTGKDRKHRKIGRLGGGVVSPRRTGLCGLFPCFTGYLQGKSAF